MTADERQRILDEEHLRLLSLFHYISGSVTVAVAAMIGLMLGMMSLAFSFVPPQGAPPGAFPEAFFLGFFGLFFAATLALGVLEIVSGRYMSRRKGRLFSIIVCIPRMLAFPYGTLLSIFTLLVLERSSVKNLYAPASA